MAKRIIIIIGGGFTGLTAAYRLSREPDFSITLVESSGHLGGLAAGFPLLGTSLEKTYHHLFPADTCILKLVEELGMNDKLMWCESSMGICRDGRIHSFMTPADLLRFRPCNFWGRLRMGFTALCLKHKKNWRGLAGRRAHEWMTKACGRSAMETVWTPLLKGKFDRHYDSVSMAWLWARIHIRANSRGPGGGREKLGYFRGGFNVITSALENELRKRGVKIQTGATVEKISTERIAAINGRTVPFDYCIFTGPSPAFARLLPAGETLDNYAEKLRSIEYLGAICLVFTSSQNLGDFYWVNVNEPGAPFLVFLNHTRLVDKSHYRNQHVYYVGAYSPVDGRLFSLADDELTRLWMSYLKKMFPEFDPAQVGERHVFRFHAAQHIVDTDYEKKIPGYRTPLPGVFLANFSQVFPEDRGTNFAVREGNKIAEMVRREAAGS
ncbi:MAG: NAD(P)/FAD-dependent oxidoreductase [Verrucomicrobiota bacterium]|jgi:protoporphyrinogen oxidase